MSLTMDFGQILTVLSILGGVGLLLLKIGRKDQQFEEMLSLQKAHNSRLNDHDNDFDALRSIIGELGKMQAVQARDHGDYDKKFADIFQRIVWIEQNRPRKVTDS